MRYGEKYILNGNSRVIIYGAATTGAVLYHHLSESGIEVIAFIDKRADEINAYYDLPVWNFEEAEKYFEKNDEVVVIVGIKNVFEHEKVARMLWRLKCSRIIFRPYSEIQGTGNAKDKELNRIYDEALTGSLSYCYVIEDFEDRILKDQGIIIEDDEWVIADIPAWYVFTDRYEGKDIIWGDIPCLGLVPHIGLFNLFLGNENDDWREYIRFCREAAVRSGGIVTSKAWEESVYSNRLDVFWHMQYAWEHDKSFFIKNAVWAELNDKGYFNIKSGKHRIVYQLLKGSCFIPLKIKKNDYFRWRNEEKAQKINEILREADIDALPVIIANPYFYDYPCNSSDIYTKVMNQLIFMIYRETYFKGKYITFEND